jgi:hypothetical protein
MPPLYAELAKLADLPWTEFDARYAAFAREAGAANPAAAALLPGMERVVAAKRRADARMVLFRAAVAVAQDGAGRLKDFKDPFGDGPFGYKAFDGGFELTSKLTYKGEPVSLVAGKK